MSSKLGVVCGHYCRRKPPLRTGQICPVAVVLVFVQYIQLAVSKQKIITEYDFRCWTYEYAELTRPRTGPGIVQTEFALSY